MKRRAKEIEASNVGFFSLPDLPSDDRAEVVELIQQTLPERARSDLALVLAEPSQPVKMDIRAVIDHVQLLADLVTEAYP